MLVKCYHSCRLRRHSCSSTGLWSNGPKWETYLSQYLCHVFISPSSLSSSSSQSNFPIANCIRTQLDVFIIRTVELFDVAFIDRPFVIGGMHVASRRQWLLHLWALCAIRTFFWTSYRHETISAFNFLILCWNNDAKQLIFFHSFLGKYWYVPRSTPLTMSSLE